MLSKATSQLYAPGSTFKLIDATAALESGKYSVNSKLPSPQKFKLPESNKYLTNYHNEVCSASGYLTMEKALDMSCNTSFAKLGIKLGINSLSEQTNKFGFSSKLKIPNPVVESSFPANMDKAQLAMSAIGQFDVKETVLQNALNVAAIANDGNIMQPTLIESVLDSSLKTVYQPAPSVYKNAMSESNAKKLQSMMISVADNGTGRIIKTNGVQIGAKTGTAETEKGGNPNTWFVSFANKGDKHLVIAVIVEGGGYAGASGTGAAVAGPVAKATMNAYLNNNK
jgi:peptidoglycan glycosyltransferase